MKSVMRRTREIAAEALGCGDCTMMAVWRTNAIQKPAKCALDERFVHCPITGEMPYDWERANKKLMFMFIEEDGDD